MAPTDNPFPHSCCPLPPPGWSCSRPAGHEGPCAASQVDRMGHELHRKLLERGSLPPGVPSRPPLRPLDMLIGQLDRMLSSFLLAASDAELDEADRQTIKHHADDLIGVGTAALERLGSSRRD